VDAVGLIVALIPDTFKQMAHKAIEAAAAGKPMLAPADRERRVRALEAARLREERIEICLIEAAAASGVTINYRPDTSPAALLAVNIPSN
jgi:hypothetical protein